MNNQTLEEIFSNYIFQVYKKKPEELPQRQAQDLKFTFYAGCLAMKDKLLVAVQDDDEDICLQKIESAMQELNTFINQSFPKHNQN